MFNAVRHLHFIIKNSSHIQHFVMESLRLMEAVNKSCHSSGQERIAGFNYSSSRILPHVVHLLLFHSMNTHENFCHCGMRGCMVSRGISVSLEV